MGADKEVLFLLSMLLSAMAMFAGDVLTVAAIVGSMWFESRIGVGWGVILDTLFVVGVSCGAAAWIIGKLLQEQLSGVQAFASYAIPKSAPVPSASHPAALTGAATNGTHRPCGGFPAGVTPGLASGAHVPP
jgi:hypothetical protein